MLCGDVEGWGGVEDLEGTRNGFHRKLAVRAPCSLRQRFRPNTIPAGSEACRRKTNRYPGTPRWGLPRRTRYATLREGPARRRMSLTTEALLPADVALAHETSCPRPRSPRRSRAASPSCSSTAEF